MMASLLKICVALAILALLTGEILAAAPAPEISVTRVDRLRITALGQVGQRQVAAGERGRILYSDDQGKSWQNAASPSSASLTALAFSDQQGIAVGHNGTLLRSGDGGKTWSATTLDAKEQPALFSIYLDGTQAIVVGSYGAYFESKDAGKTWQRRSIGSGDFDRHLTGIAVAHPGVLMIAGEAGTLMKSSDGGENWKALKSPYPGSFFGILGLKNGSVIAYGMRGQAYRSDDDGGHWQRIDLGDIHGAIQGGREFPDGRVLLYGNDGMVAIQEKGQEGFKVERLGNRRTVAAMLAVGERLLDAGPTGLHWSGKAER